LDAVGAQVTTPGQAVVKSFPRHVRFRTWPQGPAVGPSNVQEGVPGRESRREGERGTGREGELEARRGEERRGEERRREESRGEERRGEERRGEERRGSHGVLTWPWSDLPSTGEGGPRSQMQRAKCRVPGAKCTVKGGQ
jgi:hypothetical protein